MTFGSGANGCLGHGNYNDVSQAKIVEKLLGFEITRVWTNNIKAIPMLVIPDERSMYTFL